MTARKGGGNRTMIAGVVALLLVALVVGIGGYLQSRDDDPQGVPVTQAAADYPVRVADGGLVIAGDPAAPVTIDVYDDFLCPGCGQFKEVYGQQIEQVVAVGRAVVRYHPVAILDELSDPVGYATEAANAVICAAETGIFPDFHASLFAAQPAEGGAGYSAEALVALGANSARARSSPFVCERGRQRQRCRRAHQRAIEQAPPGSVGSAHPPSPSTGNWSTWAAGTGSQTHWPPPAEGGEAGRADTRLVYRCRAGHTWRGRARGAVAQLVAHLTGSQGVTGSNPVSSTQVRRASEDHPKFFLDL